MTEDLGDAIRNAKVTLDDMKTVLQAVNDMEPEDRKDFTARMLAVMSAFGLFDGTDKRTDRLSAKRRALLNKVTAAEIRAEALAGVMSDSRMQGWVKSAASNDDEGPVLLREEVLIAAAEVTLHESHDPKNKSSYFEPEEFFEKLSALSG